MRPHYLDSSALIKHYVAERGSQWVKATVFGRRDVLLFTSRITTVEVRGALARRRRESSISPRDHQEALDAFQEDCQTRIRFVEVELPVIDLAGKLLDHHPLRAYDAMQLASALTIGQVLATVEQPRLILLSADDRLLTAAKNEGLQVDNPNLHV